MNGAGVFFYVCAGLFPLALAHQLEARRATVIVSPAPSESAVLMRSIGVGPSADSLAFAPLPPVGGLGNS